MRSLRWRPTAARTVVSVCSRLRGRVSARVWSATFSASGLSVENAASATTSQDTAIAPNVTTTRDTWSVFAMIESTFIQRGAQAITSTAVASACPTQPSTVPRTEAEP